MEQHNLSSFIVVVHAEQVGTDGTVKSPVI